MKTLFFSICCSLFFSGLSAQTLNPKDLKSFHPLDNQGMDDNSFNSNGIEEWDTSFNNFMDSDCATVFIFTQS